MHELSIAQEIFSIVQQNVDEENLNSVKNVKVKIGKLSNILPDSLLFCFDAIKTNTKLQNVELKIDISPVIIECNDCLTKSEIEPPDFSCPKCNGINIKMTGGDELFVEEIELNDIIPEVK
ncbi:MAG: hydrogenase maturation nickel metallochaperone HypA [Ignavibacteria bacterium]|nr:hydrogenase maturation nickel metallochaperone HypA [Ignavibacteria bacterium]